MKLKNPNQTINLFESVDSNFICKGEQKIYPGDLKMIIVKKKKLYTLIRVKNCGFKWLNNTELTK